MQNDPNAVAASVEAEISRIQALNPSDLRLQWREAFKKDVPKALTMDLLARMLCWHIQEKVFGGHDRATLQILAGYANSSSDARSVRRLKPGTEIVREYRGERHTVVVTAEGFRWRDGEYSSLTAIAQGITGTNWNGPRFFGLRGGREGAGSAATRNKATGKERPQAGSQKARDACL